METRPRRILLSAGEASGDNYAAQLVRELRAIDPDLRISGFAGPRAEEAGIELQENLLRFSVMGIVRVLKRARPLLALMKRIKVHLDEFRPDVVVPIDFPGLNFLVAKWAKKRGIPVVFYVSPQLWAWAEWRIYKVRQRVDRMLVILPFEEDFYRNHGIQVSFVGHPLFDYLRALTLDPRVVPSLRDGHPGPLVAVLPGSRAQEIDNNLPTLLEAAAKIAGKVENVTFAVANPGHDSTIVTKLKTIIAQTPVPHLKLHLGSPYEIMKEADVALVTSGTATLELTFFETPMVVIYRCSRPAIVLGRWLTKTDHIALVNILGGREVVPEYLTFRNCASEIAHDAIDRLPGGPKRESSIADLRKVRDLMGEPGASRRAAEAILEVLARAKNQKTAR